MILLRLLIVCFWLGSAAEAAISILPGLTYYPGKESLHGKLNFMLMHDASEEATNTLSSASIYQFDLSTKQLRKVTDSPAAAGFAVSCEAWLKSV